MNKLTGDLLFYSKVMLELQALLKNYKKENPGASDLIDITCEFLDTEIIRNLKDIAHNERL